jgi:hypothetical protein
MYAAISSAAERLKAICGILGCGSSKKYASLLGSKFEDDEVWIAGKPGEPETAETKAFPQRPLAQSEIDRHVKESAGRETATERPQPRNDHPDNRNLDVWPGLVEDQDIEAAAAGKLDTSQDLIAPVKTSCHCTKAAAFH